jgi:hypothetical protein
VRIQGPRWLGLSVAIVMVASACGPSSNAGTTHVGPSETPAAGAPIATGDAPSGLVVVDEVLVVVHSYDNTVVKVERDGSLELLTQGPDGPRRPVAAFGSLWMTLPSPAGGEYEVGNGSIYSLGAVVRLDTATGDVQAQLPAHGTSLVATDTYVWVMGDMADRPGWLWRIDPESNEVAVYPDLIPTRVAQLVFDGERLWVVGNCELIPCSSEKLRLAGIEPESGSVIERGDDLPVDFVVSEAAEIDGILWIAGYQFSSTGVPTGVLLSVDNEGHLTATRDFGRFPSGIVGGGGGIWVSDCLAGTVNKLDPMSGDVIAGPIKVGTPYPDGEPLDPNREDFSCPGALAVMGDTLWVANWNDDAVVPIR